MSDERVEGPKNQGAAMAMGNTVASWGRYYHKQKHFHPRDCQAAVNAMDVWRHKATVVELEEAGKWMSAADLVLLITTARDDVEASILEAGFNPDTCKALHDVVLACTIFGYLPHSLHCERQV